MTTPAARSTDSTTTPAKCGSNCLKSPEPHTQLMPSSDRLRHKISDRAELPERRHFRDSKNFDQQPLLFATDAYDAFIGGLEQLELPI
ncbi:DUF397 domain-containing protein [Streptomyces sp. NPDC001634]|uniref:DUF397 domain-containing protein n=1 Tax=Streptomyces sp. NPDC001634 TaxID=3154390 RepID=UPI00331C6FDD